jgi:hypothetical protein
VLKKPFFSSDTTMWGKRCNFCGFRLPFCAKVYFPHSLVDTSQREMKKDSPPS